MLEAGGLAFQATEATDGDATVFMAPFYAHSLPGSPEEDWELLEDHLRRVGTGAADFAAAFGAEEWGRLLGLWHDLGKYSVEFQAYLQSTSGVTLPGSSQSRVDHSTAGAQHAASTVPGIASRILAYCIAGHHGGLPDNNDEQGGRSGLADRLQKVIPGFSSAAPLDLLEQPPPGPLPMQWDPVADKKSFQVSVFCRMLFSCLVDADYLATEAFMQPKRALERPGDLSVLADLLPTLNAHLDHFAADTPVNRIRADVLAQCRAKSELPPGFFSLTVPTGGGKTLSSLAFAFAHAARHGHRRVIYAIPFTSIIEQTAAVFREAFKDLGEQVVLEHHSNFDPPDNLAVDPADHEPQTPWYRLAAENWDAPLVVTTNVQLFESLFSNRPSRCRKLHRIARSVIILDECQTLPVTLLAPTLRMLEELCRNYGCTVVLCSATQPAITERPDFRIGIKGVREVVSDPPSLYRSLKRVQTERLGKLDDESLTERLRQHEHVLCVVSTRAHAARLFMALRNTPGVGDGVFHLSANMCAAHRTDVLAEIRRRLNPRDLQPCVVVSTQLVEAGVDVDFPVVYRSMAGLDSVAQCAGRCNREGRLPVGQVFVFDTDVDPPGDLRQRRQVGAEVAGLREDVLGLEAMEHFFRLVYWTRSSDWDKERILECFCLSSGTAHFQFRKAAEHYRLIVDSQQPVIVPYGERGRELIDELRHRHEPPGREFNRRAQRYIVNVYERQVAELRQNHLVTQYHEQFCVLENDSAYDESIGLLLEASGFDPDRFCL